jgi:hypothetical protein
MGQVGQEGLDPVAGQSGSSPPGGTPLAQLSAPSASTQMAPASTHSVDTPSVRSPKQRPGPASLVVLALVILAIGTAVLWGSQSGHKARPPVPVLLAKTDLPAYHLLTLRDVALGTRPALGRNNYATLPVDGRFLLHAIRKGAPITSTELTGNVTNFLGRRLAVVGFSVSRATVLGGSLSAGDRIQLVLSRRRHRINTLRAVVLSATPAGESRVIWSLVIALRTRDAKIYGIMLRRADLLLVPNS